ARALQIHADELAREHLVERLFADDDSALHAAVLDAFADPEGMAVESLALSPGILVVGAGEATLFSTLAVEAVTRARRIAVERGADAIAPREVLYGAVASLTQDARAALVEAGLREELAAGESTSRTSSIVESGHLFHAFSNDARRLLVLAAREASRAEEPSISPARLVLAALQTDRDLGAACGLTSHRARLLLDGRTVDATPAPVRELVVDPTLTAFLESLPEGAGSIDVALQLLLEPQHELAQILLRQKVGADRLRAARSVFSDPH
ncbi:MAG: hypothetical protein KDC14_11740, partial [Planctomycetes bacterium]|nr:hypothetical protein [Planctomycetota bacterium]